MSVDMKNEKQLKLPENRDKPNSNWVTRIVKTPGQADRVERVKRQPKKK